MFHLNIMDFIYYKLPCGTNINFSHIYFVGETSDFLSNDHFDGLYLTFAVVVIVNVILVGWINNESHVIPPTPKSAVKTDVSQSIEPATRSTVYIYFL